MKKIYFLPILLIFNWFAWGQSPIEQRCAAQILHNQKLEADPTYKSQYEEIQRKTKEFQAQQKFSRGVVNNTVREIPVYVHIIYDENIPEQNISAAQIESQIKVINEDFRALNADVSNVPAEFSAVVSDYQLTFRLEGITRKSSTITEWEVGGEMKSASTGGVDAITPETHLNMWVCKLSGSILGFAQFPGGPSETDGVVMGPEFFGSSDYDTENNFYLSAPYDKGRTTTHEIGHYLNLFHIWGDGDCTVDDEVADTPIAAEPNEGCPTYPSKSCPEDESSTSDMFMNYMDYVNDACMFMFSEGQKIRSHALFEPGGARENLGIILDGCDLPAPNGLELVQRSTTSLSLGWEEVTDAASYEIWLDGILINNSSTNSIELMGLEEATAYEIKIRANCVEGSSGAFSDILKVNTLGCYTGPLEFTITTDDYADETSWSLTYNGTVVQTDSITYQNNTTYKETFDFGDGDYKFEIFDSADDGICCGEFGDGSYSLVDNEGRIIKSGGEFGSSESVSFCVETPVTIACDAAETANLGSNLVDAAPALFEFTADEEKEYIISAVGFTNVNTDLVIYNDCDILLAENDDFVDLQSEVSIVLSAGQKIQILWKDTYTTAGFEWTINGGKSSQSISFSDLPEKNVNDEPFALSATASSGLPVTYTSANNEVATVSGNTLTIVGAGQTTITATQEGNEDFLAAPAVQKVMTVNKLNQTIAITPIPDKFTTDPDFEVEASASSGLGLTYEISGPATINDNIISLDGNIGTVSLTINQVGNEVYNPVSASVNFEVSVDPCLGFSIAEIITSAISCSGENDGVIEVLITEGTAPFKYSLNGGSNVESNIWEGLAAGEYSIAVTDANECLTTASTIIESPQPLEISAEVTNSTSIAGNGAIELIVSGGTGDYAYLWSNGAISSMIDGLEMGVYSVIVTDENGCSLEETFEVGGVTANNNLKQDDFIIYPNPVKDYLMLNHNDKINQVKIYDAKGNLVRALSSEEDKTNIEVKDFQAGLYFIQINNKNHFYRFIKD